MSEQLKPCPFCGGEAILEECSRSKSHLPAHDFAVRCDTCCASTRRYFPSKEEAIEAWNKRVDATRIAEIHTWKDRGDSIMGMITCSICGHGVAKYEHFCSGCGACLPAGREEVRK